MKKIFLFSVSALVAFIACDQGKTNEQGKKEIVSFYAVPLICGADPAIGCGSRAKPALLEMEKNPAIKEAWLNRTGTVYAIVWSDSAQTERIAKPIFNQYDIDYTELKDSDLVSNSATFRKVNLWYRGADVDKLSIEEATHIANTYIDFSLEHKMISKEDADKIKPQIESYFKAELVKVRTPNELDSDSKHKFQKDLVAIFTKSIGKEKTDKLAAMYIQYKQDQYKKKSCCTKDSTDACCKKK